MPSDLPPQSVIINNTNQSGGSNTGIVNNFGPKERKLTGDQKDRLRSLLLKLPKQNISFQLDSNATDAESYGQDIADCFPTSVYTLKAVGHMMNVTPKYGLIIVTYPEDPSNPILKAFTSAGIEAKSGAGYKGIEGSVLIEIAGNK